MRRRQHTLTAVLLTVTCASLPSVAQEVLRGGENVPADTVQRINAVSIIFDHNLNTYNWVDRAAIDTLAGGIHIGFVQQYAANIIQLESPATGTVPKLQSNQQNISLLLRAPVTEVLAPQLQWSSFVYTDNKGTGLNNASSYTLLGGADCAALPWLFLTPMAGYRWDSQAGIRDQGMAYAFGARVPGIDVDGYQIAGTAQYREDHLDPRKLEGDFARIGIEKIFSPHTRDSLEAGFSRSRREFYAPADSNIESRTDQVLTFANKLDYAMDPSFTTTLFAAFYDRGLDKEFRNWNAVGPRDPKFDTRIEEFRLETYAQTVYRPPDGGWGGWLRFFYGERTEHHAAKRPSISSPTIDILYAQRNKQEQINDNLSRRTVVSGAVDVPLSFSDRLSLTGSAGILRYDTPSDLNFEDRDELLVVLTLATSHRVSRALDLGFSLDGTFSHTVYLLKERSANNSVNRVLRLSPRTLLRPASWITSMNAFEVLANYTVYDFEQQLNSVKSYSYRQFGWSDSTAFDLTHRLGLDIFAYLRVYERGELNWSDFTERTENSVTEQTFAVQLRFNPDERTRCAVGFRYFGQSRYTYDAGNPLLDTFLSSVGPTCTILWEPGAHSRLQFQGWYEQRHQPDGSVRLLSNMTMNIYFNL